MSWNRPQGGEAQSVPSRKKQGNYLRGILAAAIVVVGAIVAWFSLSRGMPSSAVRDTSPRPAVIREVTPAAAPTNRVAEAAKPKGPPPGVTKGKDGLYWWPNGARWVNPDDPVRVMKKPESRMSRLFKRGCDKKIAGLLEVEPGDTLVGTVMYGRDFRQDFLDSLNDPFVYDKDEPKEDRALKAAVWETKKELKKRMDAGEDIVKILKDTREELQRLAAFKTDIRRLVDEQLHNAECSDSDFKLCVQAANEMLAKEGLPPMKNPSMVMRKMILKRQQSQPSVNNEERK